MRNVTSKSDKPVQVEPMTWLDKLLLFSPSTWFGFLYQLHRSPFTQFRFGPLVRSILSLLLPFLVMLCAKLDPRISLPMSPWAISIVQKGILPPILDMYKTAQLWRINRVNPISTSAFAERITAGRCIRFARFDVHIPEWFSGHVLLWLPGALIAHTAYSDIMSHLVDDTGICVVTVSMEPCRMASPWLGATASRLKRIQTQLQRRQRELFKHPIQKWSVGGHSMGSFAAMALANHVNATSLIMWASANLRNTRTDLSKSSLHVLVLQGSEDKLCQMDDASRADFEKDFPPHTVYETIQGGIHRWFASIDPGDPTIVGAPTTKDSRRRNSSVPH